MRSRVSFLFVAVAAAVVATAARADQVILTDGSTLVGTIERLMDGKLYITTDFAGKLEIDAAKVKSISSSGKVNVGFKTGDTLLGVSTSSADGSSAKVSSGVGDVSYTIDQVSAVWPEGAPGPAEIAAQKEIEKLTPKWTASIEGGIVATDGNTDTLVGRARAEVNRKSSVELFKLYASADYGEQNDERNKNEYIAGGRYEHSIWGEKAFWYARTEFEYDEFEDLDLRATAALGLGYYWLKKPEHELKTSVGGGYRHQAFMDGSTTDDPILDLGLDYRLDVAAWATFAHSTYYNPSLEDFGDYRLVFDTSLMFPIGKTEQWKFKTGVKNEYNSDPQPGFDRLDNTYYANLVLEFK